MIKKAIFTSFLFLAFISAAGAQKVYRLDAGIAKMASNLATRLPMGTKVVVYDINATTPEASSYIIDGLTIGLLSSGNLRLVDRTNLSKVRSELAFQMSGDVSDESAQRLGEMLGAETLVTGSFDLFKGKYRLSIKAIEVESAEIQFMATVTIANNAETESLLGKKNPNTSGAAAAAAVGNAAKSVLDFSGRLICSTINPVLGLGSYMQGDLSGGAGVTFWELASFGSIGYGQYLSEENPDDDTGNILSYVGAIVLIPTVIYAIIRPWQYNRKPSYSRLTPGVTFGLDSIASIENIIPVSFKCTVRY